MSTERNAKKPDGTTIYSMMFDAGRSPLGWLLSAMNLKRAADRLFNVIYLAALRNESRHEQSRPQLRKSGSPASAPRKLNGKELEDELDEQMLSVYFFLMATAIENALKGIAIARNPSLVDSNEELDKSLTNHRLIELAEMRKIELSESDRSC